MGHWAKPPLEPDQVLLFYPTLRGSLAEDHPVHLVDEVLERYDWAPWERQYVLVEGQPPIHPRFLAGAIVYGLSAGVRSSRALEGACKSRLDMMLLVHGHTPDHTTFAKFRTRFKAALKDLFRFLGRTAMEMGMARLNGLALDGTRVRANSSRHETATAKTIEERLAALDEQVAGLLAEAEQADQEEDTLFGKEASPHRLGKKLATLERRQEALSRALAKAQAQEAQRKEDGSSSRKAPKVPVADPDAAIQPNKEGGFAPNYTPMAAVETHGGFILDADVLPDSDEGQATVATVDRVEAAQGQRPEEFLADSKHGSGATLAALAARGIEGYIPLEQRHDRPDNPAHRPDPTVPVPESDWPRLPRNPVTKKLDRAAFAYDPAADAYWCPVGRRLAFHHQHTQAEKNSSVVKRIYRCAGCTGCPLAAECRAGKAPYRTVCRDEHEGLREAMDARLKTPEGRRTYARRKWTSETVFGFIKGVMGIRQFLLRGLDKVRTEWLWACAAYNLGKLVRGLARRRGHVWAGAG